jgi:hypothetical protein
MALLPWRRWKRSCQWALAPAHSPTVKEALHERPQLGVPGVAARLAWGVKGAGGGRGALAKSRNVVYHLGD